MLFLGLTPAVQLTMEFRSIRPGDVTRAIKTTRTASGKSINAARVARTLAPETPVVASGFLGGDTGAFIRGDLNAIGIRHEFVDVGHPTRTCITVIDHTAATTELIEESSMLPKQFYEAMLAKLPSLLCGRRVLALSGSLPPAAPADFYERCCRCAAQAGVMSILDARGPALIHALRACPTVIKPNRDELAQTVGRPLDTETDILAAARELIAAGARGVIVTRGSHPILACDAASAWRVTLPTINAVSPIGSGDALTGGLAVGLLRGHDLPTALPLAAACGSANALRPVSGVVDPADVQRLQREIKIEAL